MKKFDYICHQKNKVNTFMWYDKKVVAFISTFSNFDTGDKMGVLMKKNKRPAMIHDYNQNMGGVINIIRCSSRIFRKERAKSGQISLQYILFIL